MDIVRWIERFSGLTSSDKNTTSFVLHGILEKILLHPLYTIYVHKYIGRKAHINQHFFFFVIMNKKGVLSYILPLSDINTS